MDIIDLTNKESELFSIVLATRGAMEDKHRQLKEKGVFDAYCKVHSSYASKADKSLEFLKRGLFIQWYAVIEPACFTGISTLDENAEQKIITSIDNLIKSGKSDYELKWMLTYYFGDEFVFERFEEFKRLKDWVQNRGKTELPDKIDREEMRSRGQMGEYWNSLSQFA